jgi:GNAT superfamily N-acetyltransferase
MADAGNFRVSLASKDVIKDYVLPYSEKMIGSIGKMDEELFWAAGPGIYVGELEGELITGISMIQHSEAYGYASLYYCEDDHRGKGFGLKTWQTSRAAIDQKVNLGLDAVPSVVHIYERSGFKRAWNMGFSNFRVSSVIEAYRNLSVANISTKPATAVNFAELRLYTEDVIGINFTQAGLLEKYVTLPTHVAVVAVSESGKIVGFAVMRECRNNGEHRLAPLLADTGDIARLLLLQLAKNVDQSQKFNGYMMEEINPEAKKIAEEIKGEKITDLIRMYTGEDPPIRKEKYFGLFSIELAG